MTLNPIEFIDIYCPHCSARFDVQIDTSIPEQQYVEDCHVCCSAILINLFIDIEDEKIDVSVSRENE